MTQEQINAIRFGTAQPQAQPKQGFLRTLGQEVLEPFAKVAATGEKSLSQLLLGKNTSTDADFTRNVLGREVGPAKTGREFAGAVLETGSNFIPVPVVGGLGRNLVTQGIKNIKPLKSLLQGAGIGGTVSSLGAVGDAIQDPNKTVGDIAKRGAMGFGTGAAVGVAAPFIGRGIQKAAASRGNKVAQEAEKAVVQSRVPQIKDKLAERLPQNTALRNKVRQNTGMDVEDLIIEEGIPFGRKGDNLFDFSEALEDVIPTRKQALGNSLETLLGTVQKTGDLDDISRRAIREVRNAPKGTYKIRQDEIISNIKKIIDREKQSFGKNPKYDVLNRIKSAGYDRWDGKSADARAGQAISKVIKDLIEKEFSDGTNASNIIREVNKRYANLINLENYLKKVDNRTVRGGKLGRAFNQLIGAVSGSQGGIIGSLLGSEVAGRVTDAVLDPTRISNNILDDMVRAGVIPASLRTANEAKEYVINNQRELIRQLINPQTKALPAGVPQPIQLPSAGILEGQRNIRR